MDLGRNKEVNGDQDLTMEGVAFRYEDQEVNQLKSEVKGLMDKAKEDQEQIHEANKRLNEAN